MSAQALSTQRDEVKKPQFVIEGRTPATYGITPTNPAFVQALRDGVLVEGATPTTADLRTVGKTYNRDDKIKVREVNTINLKGYPRGEDKSLITAFFNTPGNEDYTANTSFTFITSRRNAAGIEEYYVYKGCKIETCSIAVDNNGFTTLDATLRYQRRFKQSVAEAEAMRGTGSFIEAETGDPLTHTGTALTYNGAAISIRTGTITATWTSAIQDAAGSLYDLYCQPVMGLVSGTFDIFKQGDVLQQDALDVAGRAAIFKIKNDITFTMANLIFDVSGEEVKGDSADATIESKAFEANSVVVS